MSIRFPNPGIVLEYVPRNLKIAGFELTIYGILIGAGMLLGIFLMLLEGKRRGQNPNQLLGMCIPSILLGVVGARMVYVLLNWGLYKSDIQEIINIRNGGLSFYGGLLGGVAGAAIFCKLSKCSFAKMADTACIGLLTAQIVGRWGDFFNRESFGEYTDSYFAMQMPLSSVRSGEVSALMRENLVTIDGTSYIQAHPVFLYESVLCLILLLFLLGSRRRKKFQGEIFMRYLALYGLIRCFMEWLRTDKLLIPGTKLPFSLGISIFLFLFFGTEAMVRRAMEKKRAEARRRRREAFYAAEEEAEAEMDRLEQEKQKRLEQEQQAKAAEEEPEEEWDGRLPSERMKEETEKEVKEEETGIPSEGEETEMPSEAEETGTSSEAEETKKRINGNCEGNEQLR